MREFVLAIMLITFLTGISFAAGGGDITYKVKYIGDVTFSHDSHVTGRGFTCDDCHPVIFPLPRDKEKKRTMAEMRAKKACGTCHNGKNAFDVGSNCYICHKK